jgi:dipeptidyl aminopeptidase/acylaminoacyl peptidase
LHVSSAHELDRERTSTRSARRSRVLLLTLALASACSDSPSDPAGTEPDVEALFAPPTAAEISAVLADWADRDVSVQGFREEQRTALMIGAGTPATLRIVSHAVGGARHYGAIIAPDQALPGSVPVLVYAHGGDAGASVEEAIFLSASLGALGGRFVWVVPSFRSETLRAGSSSWTSEGSASPWDRDVDDALGLVNATLGSTPVADPERIAVLGLSRGAGVGLLMAARDARIERVVEFFGPTDFFGPHVRQIVEEALRGQLRSLPGLSVLNARYLQPFAEGSLALAEMRRQLLQRSPAYFVDRIGGVQVHHGTGDDVVDVSHAESLIDRLEDLGRGPPDFEFHIYPGGEHNPLTLPGSPQRAMAYLGGLAALALEAALADGP